MISPSKHIRTLLCGGSRRPEYTHEDVTFRLCVLAHQCPAQHRLQGHFQLGVIVLRQFALQAFGLDGKEFLFKGGQQRGG